MSEYDAMASQAFQLLRAIEQCVTDYDPLLGDDALSFAQKLIIVIDKFPEEWS